VSATVNEATPSVGMLNPRPPRTYVEWTVRGIDPNSGICMVTFSEADARRAHAGGTSHGEPVELLRREITTWTETRYTDYESVNTDA